MMEDSIKEKDNEEKSKRYLDPQAPIESRIDDLLNKFKLDEKIALLSGKDTWHLPEIKRLDMKSFAMTDGPHGVRYKSAGNKKATYFPTSIGLAHTWNPDLALKFGMALGQETRAVGSHMLLCPGMNIDRTPLNGRTFEYLTEDPYLNKTMIVSIIKGIQSQKIAACAKHFICNNQETRRFSYDAQVSERAIQEIYLPAFKSAVNEGNVWAIMGSYNKINGLYGCAHDRFLNQTLVGDWGFNKMIVSDWGATKPIRSTIKCIRNHLTTEMPKAVCYKPGKIKKALKKGLIKEEQMDQIIKRILRVMFSVGLFDPIESLPEGEINTEEHFSLAREIAEESIVLLKNEDNALPINLKNINEIAVFGPNVDRKHGFGGGSSEVLSLYEITPFEGLKNYIERFNKRENAKENTKRNSDKIKIQKNPQDPQSSDIIIYFGGLNHDDYMDAESKDRKEFNLPEEQIDEINKLSNYNKRLIVILINGSPVRCSNWISPADAVLEAWYPGMEGGNAIARLLFGDVNPSGKLTLTFPVELKDSPAHKSRKTYPGIRKVFYEEDIYVGYRYFDTFNLKPQFPFGHGLSYTAFEYSEIQINLQNSQKNTHEIKIKDLENISLTLSIRNTGNFAGKETIQLYIRNIKPQEDRPFQELKGYRKIFLDIGEEKELSFALNGEMFSYFSNKKKSWTIDPGEYNIAIGSSSRDIRSEMKILLK